MPHIFDRSGQNGLGAARKDCQRKVVAINEIELGFKVGVRGYQSLSTNSNKISIRLSFFNEPSARI